MYQKLMQKLLLKLKILYFQIPFLASNTNNLPKYDGSMSKMWVM
jgi:hypothetical protein